MPKCTAQKTKFVARNPAHEMAHLSLTRIENVAKREPGLVPQQEVDEIRSRDLESEAQVAAAKSNLAASRGRIQVLRADEAVCKTMHNYETITAPFEGVVTKRYANTGAMIQAGTASQSQAMPLVRVSQNSLLRLILPVPGIGGVAGRIGRSGERSGPVGGQNVRGRVARFTDKVTAFHAHYGYRSGCAESLAEAGTGHVRRGGPGTAGA